MPNIPRDQLVTEVLEELRYIRAHTSLTSELIANGVRNHVLEVRTITFDATGMWQASWGATCGSIEVRNLSSTNGVVVAAGPASTTPTGVGAWTVPAGQRDIVGIYSRTLTLYGTSGQQCCYQAYTVNTRTDDR